MESIMSYLWRFVGKVFALSLVGLLAVPVVVMAEHPAIPESGSITTRGSRIPILQAFAVTEEGWWIILTNNKYQVASMCGEPLSDEIVGCARWPYGENIPEVYPAKYCLVMIYVSNPDEHVSDIVEHELKHCRTGEFHK
jgi:hypothetical protein